MSHACARQWLSGTGCYAVLHQPKLLVRCRLLCTPSPQAHVLDSSVISFVFSLVGRPNIIYILSCVCVLSAIIVLAHHRLG